MIKSPKILTLITILFLSQTAPADSINCDYNHLKKLTLNLETHPTTNSFNHVYNLNYNKADQDNSNEPEIKIYINSDLCDFFKTNKNKIGFKSSTNQNQNKKKKKSQNQNQIQIFKINDLELGSKTYYFHLSYLLNNYFKYCTEFIIDNDTINNYFCYLLNEEPPTTITTKTTTTTTSSAISTTYISTIDKNNNLYKNHYQR